MAKNYYTFRLDINWKSDEYIKKLLIPLADFIKANFCKYCIFKEIADITKKEHLQGWVGCTWAETKARKILQESAYKKYFQKSSYSLTIIKDFNKYTSYCCKQGDAWINNLLTPEEIIEINKKYEESSQENISEKKVRTLTFSQKLFKEYILREKNIKILRGLYYQYNLTDDEKKLLAQEKDNLLEYILNKLGNLVQSFDKHSLAKIYNGILNAILQDDTSSRKKQLNHWRQILDI